MKQNAAAPGISSWEPRRPVLGVDRPGRRPGQAFVMAFDDRPRSPRGGGNRYRGGRRIHGGSSWPPEGSRPGPGRSSDGAASLRYRPEESPPSTPLRPGGSTMFRSLLLVAALV